MHESNANKSQDCERSHLAARGRHSGESDQCENAGNIQVVRCEIRAAAIAFDCFAFHDSFLNLVRILPCA